MGEPMTRPLACHGPELHKSHAFGSVMDRPLACHGPELHKSHAFGSVMDRPPPFSKDLYSNVGVFFCL